MREIKSVVLNNPKSFKDIPEVRAEFSPGMGVVFTSSPSDKLEDTYVMAYYRGNPALKDPNIPLQACISIGGKVDPSKSLIESVNQNTLFKTQVNSLELQLTEADITGVPASVYNEKGDDWNMSYVYIQKNISKDLLSLRAIVNETNQKIEEKRKQDPNARLSNFGIYRLEDIKEIIKTNAEKTEKEKQPKKIKNYLTDKDEEVIVFDDYATKPLLNRISQPLKSYDLTQPEDNKLANFDGAGVLYAVMHKGELHFVMRERVSRGKSQYQVGVGGKFDHATDRSRFQRAKDETEEEFYGQFSLGQGMLLRHEDGKRHLVHYTGDMGSWAYVSGIAINNQPGDIEKRLSHINYLNHLLWSFGDFFINNLQFNSNYSLEQAKKTAGELLISYEQNPILKNYVPGEIAIVLKYINQSKTGSLDELKNLLIQEVKLQSKRPFIELVDRVHADINSHALGDYTEAKSSGLIKATELVKILKDPAAKAQIVYNSGQDTKVISGADIFNNDASTALLSAMYSPAYESQLVERVGYTQAKTTLKSEKTLSAANVNQNFGTQYTRQH